MALFKARGIAREVFLWSSFISALFCVARCDIVVCNQCGGGVTPVTTRVNILDQSNGLYLWVNPQGKLSSGAVDIGEASSIFEIHLYNPDNPSTFWNKTALALEPAMVVAANFSADPRLVVVRFDQSSGIYSTLYKVYKA